MSSLINKPKAAKILFIKGVFKKDCVSDEIFEKKILENISEDSILASSMENGFNVDYVNYEKLAPIFEDINSWQKKTNLLCWNCSLSFSSIPVFIPQVIEPISHRNHNNNRHQLQSSQDQSCKGQPPKEQSPTKYSIGVYGVFCSFICTKHYVNSHNYSLIDRIEIMNKLKLLYKLFYNMKMNDVSNYPTPLQMQQYGGDLSTSEFLELLECSKKEEASY
jgi:hypothetical protein